MLKRQVYIKPISLWQVYFTCHWEMWGLCFLPLEFGQGCDCSKNNVMRLLRLAHKNLYNSHLVFMGYLILKPNHHAVKKPIAHGEVHIARNWDPRNTFLAELPAYSQSQFVNQMNYTSWKWIPQSRSKPSQPIKCGTEMFPSQPCRLLA